MKLNIKSYSAMLLSSLLLFPAVCYGQGNLKQPSGESSMKAGSKTAKGPVKSPSGVSFSLSPSPQGSSQFNVVMTDGEEQVISGVLTVEELRAVRAIIEEAREFAFNGEAVGTQEPITTRISSSEAPGFAVDVTKFENQSQFFVTLTTLVGQITTEGGTVNRSEKKGETFLFDILSRIESQLPHPTQINR